MNFPSRAQQGFTLIEVMAALLIIALTMGGIIEAISFQARNARYLQDKTIAGWVAHNQMTDASLAQQWPKTGISNGQFAMAERQWFWEREVQETPDDRIRRITVRVRRADDSARPSRVLDEESWLVTLSGFFAEPSGPALTQ